jgi:hypothetical protein
MKIYSSSIALCLAAAVLFSPAVVMAEEGTIEEIVVTAQKREQAVTDVEAVVSRLLAQLVTNAPAKNREAEAAKARARAERRFGSG